MTTNINVSMCDRSVINYLNSIKDTGRLHTVLEDIKDYTLPVTAGITSYAIAQGILAARKKREEAQATSTQEPPPAQNKIKYKKIENWT